MWEKKFRGSMQEYFNVADPLTCPIWNWLLPKLLRDRGWEDRASKEGISQYMWEYVKESRANITKGTKANLTRLFGAHARSMEFDKYWHEELLNFIMLCLMTDIVENIDFASDLALKLNAKAPPDPAAEGGGGGMQQGVDHLNKLMSSVNNTYHLGLYLLLDENNQTTERIECACAQPLWTWYNDAPKALRGCEESLQWKFDQISGECMIHLNQVFAALFDAATLEHCKLRLSLSPDDQGLDTDDYSFIMEQEMANLMGNFACSIISHRVRRNIWFWLSWPSRCVLFAHKDPFVANNILEEFLRDVRLFSDMKERTEAWWKQAGKRSNVSGSVPADTFQ